MGQWARSTGTRTGTRTSLLRNKKRRRTSIEAIVQLDRRTLGVLLNTETNVHVADQMVANIVAHMHLLDLAVPHAELDEDILVEIVKVRLNLLWLHPVVGKMLRVLVHVANENSLAERGLVMYPKARVAMAAGTNLVVERTVDPTQAPS